MALLDEPIISFSAYVTQHLRSRRPPPEASRIDFERIKKIGFGDHSGQSYAQDIDGFPDKRIIKSQKALPIGKGFFYSNGHLAIVSGEIGLGAQSRRLSVLVEFHQRDTFPLKATHD